MTDSPVMTLRFTLPWPPSVNTYWRHIVLGGKFKKAQARVLLSEQGRRYQVDSFAELARQRVPRGAVKGRLALVITAFPPDRRQRDLDNLLKGTLDALKHARVIADDGDIDELLVKRGPVRPQGIMELEVRELGSVVCVQPVLPLEEATPTSKAFARAYANEPKPREILRKLRESGETVTIKGDPF